MGQKYASTVVCALSARSAAGHKYARTVVSALRARSAAGVESASTAVSAIIARSAMGMEYARTVVSVIRARSVVVHKQTLVLAKKPNNQIKNVQSLHHGKAPAALPSTRPIRGRRIEAGHRTIR